MLCNRFKLGCFCLLLPLALLAHPGRTDSSDGHNCSAKSVNKGLCSRYHYHNNGTAIITPKSSATQKYNRKHFGGWIDIDGDCQSTQAEGLIDHSATSVKPTNCLMIVDNWVDIYTGATYTYTNASDLDLDDLVPIKGVWGNGADERDKIEEEEKPLPSDC